MALEQQAHAAEDLLVTGSGGFIGRRFLAAFGGQTLDDADGTVDLRDADRVARCIDRLRPQAVVHLAAQSSVPESFRNQRETYAINFDGTLNLLTALAAMDFSGTFLFVSSADVYGSVPEADLPIRECRPLLPRSPYAVSKVSAEALCFQWSQTGSFRVVMARPFNQIGPGQDARFAVSNFARQIAEIKAGRHAPVMHTGDLDVTRDFTDVRDSVHALRLLLGSGRNGEAYNICSGQERTVRSLVEALLQAAGVQAELTVDAARLRPVEQRRVVGDNTKLVEHTGWRPETPFQTTVNDIFRHTERELNG